MAKIRLVEDHKWGIPNDIKINPNSSEEDLKIAWGKISATPKEIHKDGSLSIDTLRLQDNRLTSIPFYFRNVYNGLYLTGQFASLEGCPKEVGGAFFLVGGSIKTLEYAPKTVKNSVYINNTDITSLEYAPRPIFGNFNCADNDLTSLNGAMKRYPGNFDCSHNKGLETLEGGPEEVQDNFLCDNCGLYYLRGMPKKVGGSFTCKHNAVTFKKEYIEKYCDVKGNIYNED